MDRIVPELDIFFKDDEGRKVHKDKIYMELASHNQKLAGCYNCLQIFPASKVQDYSTETLNGIDFEGDALCPFCEVDCVIVNQIKGQEVTREILRNLNYYWLES